jgi:hypothetical protein
VNRTTHVLFVPYVGAIVGNCMVSPLVRKRRLFWTSDARNTLVCGLAVGMAQTPRKTLRTYGVESVKIGMADLAKPRVAILAEAAEHAYRLRTTLPDWALYEAVPVTNTDEYDPAETNEEAAPAPGRIVTLMHAARYGLSADVLVRATGGRGKLNWKAIQAGGGWAGTMPALVVDIADESDDHGRADTDTRRREYRDQGLVVIGSTTKTTNHVRSIPPSAGPGTGPEDAAGVGVWVPHSSGQD